VTVNLEVSLENAISQLFVVSCRQEAELGVEIKWTGFSRRLLQVSDGQKFKVTINGKAVWKFDSDGVENRHCDLSANPFPK
jgi:hypothetical protein